MTNHVNQDSGHDVVMDATTLYCVRAFVWTSTKMTVLTQKHCQDQ